jgi:cellulose synthase/poly-beta-1,6-N-acetylglucosamine synthase-like glycosyltransferase
MGLSSIFYLGLRIYSIQFMDKHIWFAVYSLIGEATLISSNVWYCLYLMFQMKPINHVVMKDESELILKRKYTIYVLVPCYKEPLEIISKTITSILRAREGFEMIDILIYLCDDGNDPEKKEYI